MLIECTSKCAVPHCLFCWNRFASYGCLVNGAVPRNYCSVNGYFVAWFDQDDFAYLNLVYGYFNFCAVSTYASCGGGHVYELLECASCSMDNVFFKGHTCEHYERHYSCCCKVTNCCCCASG